MSAVLTTTTALLNIFVAHEMFIIKCSFIYTFNQSKNLQTDAPDCCFAVVRSSSEIPEALKTRLDNSLPSLKSLKHSLLGADYFITQTKANISI